MLLAVYGVAGFLGSFPGNFPSSREIYSLLTFRRWCHLAIVGWGFRFGLWAVFFSALISMPEKIGWRMALAASCYLIFLVLMHWGLFRKILRQIKFLTPAGRRLQQIVYDASAKMQVKVRHTWEMDSLTANAFALPVTGELIFTSRLLDVCTDREIAVICAHELAHLGESKKVLAVRLLGSLKFFPLIFIKPAIHYFEVAGIFILYLCLWMFSNFGTLISRQMEQRADQMALTEQSEAGVYARALEKLYRANQTPAVSSNRTRTHPHLYNRMVAAGITPDYPRPKKPRRLNLCG